MQQVADRNRSRRNSGTSLGIARSASSRAALLALARRGALALVPFVCLLLGGCARAPVPDYVLSEATQQLPERHRQQIESALTQLFGTPLAPQLATIPPEQTKEGQATPDQVDEAGSADKGASEGEQASEASAAPAAAQVKFDIKFAEAVEPGRLLNGAQIYRNQCAGCHGVSGDGNGEAAAYLQPKPRDYRRGIYKFTSTPYGMKPARSDLVRTIRRGAKGTSMPAFPWMSQQDLNDVIDYIVSLSQRGEVETSVALLAQDDYAEDEDLDPADFLDALTNVQESWAVAEKAVVLPVSAEPAYDDASIALGRQAFLSRGCSKCHGEDGKGQTEWLSHEFLSAEAAKPEAQRIQINYDAWGYPAPAADLTARMLHGGRRPLDIYRRIYTGINGTPMPAFGEALAAEPDTLWHMVHYVLSVVEGRPVGTAQAASQAADTSSES